MAKEIGGRIEFLDLVVFSKTAFELPTYEEVIF